jgi:hypothetical protein
MDKIIHRRIDAAVDRNKIDVGFYGGLGLRENGNAERQE